MEIHERIISYIHNPFPLWNEEIANLLIDYKWDKSLKNVFKNRDDYSITGCVLKDGAKKEKTLPFNETSSGIKIAFPSDSLTDFYNEHGLVPSDINVSFDKKVEKINNALNILGKVKPLQSFIFQLVKSVQIIEPEHADTDISYSHPNIPFSIFFSLCEDDSIISDLRVAESILHESMHLMLTLIENEFDLIIPDSKETFYSPWRDEKRPLRGVLHGLFVFRAILEFYSLMESIFSTSSNALGFIRFRIEQIKLDIYQLKKFPSCPDLTKYGAILTANLLPLN